jgi:hypothetical protein
MKFYTFFILIIFLFFVISKRIRKQDDNGLKKETHVFITKEFVPLNTRGRIPLPGVPTPIIPKAL